VDWIHLARRRKGEGVINMYEKLAFGLHIMQAIS
jgi:hypothetical protein